MRVLMKLICWAVFLTFIALSSFANWEHGSTFHASFMLAVVPVGFAATVFILEGILSAGKGGWMTYTGVTFVAAAAGIASYIGLYGMARDNGIGVTQAALMPLAFDGVVAVASMGVRAFSTPLADKAVRLDDARPATPRKVVAASTAKTSVDQRKDLPELGEAAPSMPLPAPPSIVHPPARRARPAAKPSTARRSASPDRELAVKRVLAGESASEVARSLGIPVRNVQIWAKAARDAAAEQVNRDSPSEGSPS